MIHTPRGLIHWAFALAILSFLIAGISRAEVIRVAASATGPNPDGQSWQTAFRTLSEALAAAAEGDELWIARGTYGPATLTRAVSLYGGFTGVETARDQRNPRRYVSRVNGGPLPGLSMADLATEVVVDGLTFQSQQAGIRCKGSPLRVIGSVFYKCRTGISADATSRLTATSCAWKLNDTGVSVGRLASLTGNLFVGNAKGVVFLQTSGSTEIPRLLRNQFLGNATGVDAWTTPVHCWGNTVSKNGTGLSVPGYSTIVNNTLVHNRIALNQLSYSRVHNNIFAYNDQAIYPSVYSHQTITHCCFFGNRRNYSGQPKESNLLFEDPQLVAREYGNLHIQPSSPCRDAGSSTVTDWNVSYNSFEIPPDWLDIDDQSRIQGSQIDIGADESDGTLWPSTSPVPVIFVRADGSDDADGLSWATAKQTVQAGCVEAAIHGSEVWVTAGTYRENVLVPPSVSLFGGFTGTETDRDQRDPRTHRSLVIASNPVDPVLSVAWCPVPVTIDGLTVSGADEGIKLDSPGTTLRSVRVTNCETGIRGGAAMTVDACDLRGNAVALHLTGAPATAQSSSVTNTVFAGNGIGVRCINTAAPYLINNTFLANTVALSAGNKASVRVTNNLIAGNGTGLERSETAATIFADHCCLWGNRVIASGLPDPLGADGNFAQDPEIVSTSLGDIHLQPGSPCVDSGDDAAVAGPVDIDGQPRRQGVSVDIGADESDGITRSAVPAIVRVSSSGDDANDGATWGQAKASIQAGLDAAGIRGGEVWVADGVYMESLRLPAFVSIYGGFKGSESLRTERRPIQDGTALEPADAGLATVTVYTGLAGCTVDGLTLRYGGNAIYMDASSPTLAGCWFTGNETGVYAFYRSSPRIEDCGFEENGTGVLCDNASEAIIVRNRMRYNETGLFAFHSAPTLSNSLITEGAAGVDSLWSAGTSLVNNTLARNTIGIAMGRYSKPQAANNIVSLNEIGIWGDVHGNAPVLRYNDVGGNAAANYDGTPDATGTFGNIRALPMFQGEGSGNYHLWATSPCVDAGDSRLVASGDLDLDRLPRIHGPNVDMGAYEYQTPADAMVRAVVAMKFAGGLLPASPADAGSLDVDGDRTVSLRDALLLSRQAGPGR